MLKLYSRSFHRAGDHRVGIGFTSTNAGNLGLHVGEDQHAVLAHREALEHDLLPSGQRFTYLNQVHGTTVFDADTAQPVHDLEHTPEADTAVSRRGAPLAVMVADCIPVVFVGSGAEGFPVTAVAHAGRRGLLDGVLQETVQAMVRCGAEDIHAWLGPSICGKCYEVPQDMLEESARRWPELASTTSWGTPALDLPATAMTILRQSPEVSAVSDELSGCTFEDTALFSHRREPGAGRIAGLVWIDQED